jgi:hypothetical protein
LGAASSLAGVSLVTGFSTVTLEGSLFGIGVSTVLETCGFSIGFEISGAGLATLVGVSITLTGA